MFWLDEQQIFDAARRAKANRVLFCEGEQERVLRAVQLVVDQGLARPTLVGRRALIAARSDKLGLRLAAGRDYELVDTEPFEREMRRHPTLIGSTLLRQGEVDGMICGTWGVKATHLESIDSVIGKRAGARTYACMNVLMLPGRQVFVIDAQVHHDPSAEQLAEITRLAAEEIERFGTVPRVVLLQDAHGFMHGEANLLVLPNVDAANTACRRLRSASGGGTVIGPVLLGAAQPVHLLTPATSVRSIVGMTALTVADADQATKNCPGSSGPGRGGLRLRAAPGCI